MGAMLSFGGWIAVLSFALYQSERRSTRLWLIFCISLNLLPLVLLATNGDGARFQAFEGWWK